jgi:hypothetical protein
VSRLAAAVLAVVGFFALSLPMSAQLLPSGNVYVGVSYGSLTNVVVKQSYRGWNASGEDILFSNHPHLGFVVDTSGFYRTSINTYIFLGGARLATNYGRWRPFAHALGGVRHTNSSGFITNQYQIDAGGGVDYKLSFRNFSWRVQGDYMFGHYLSATQNDFRASTGLVWRF